MKMEINQIIDKTYYDLTEEETRFFNKLIKEHNATPRQKDIIFIALLFRETIKQSIQKMGDY